MAEVRLGIIGTGMIAKMHAHAIRDTEGARLTAVYDQVPERAQAFAAEHGVDAVPDLARFLARDDVDAVTIATPSGAHADVAVPAGQAGKHVLCEKPIEVNVERADRIIEACRTHNVLLACVFQSRTGANIQRIRQALLDGRFGRLVLLDVQVKWYRNQEYYDSADWRGTWRLDGGGTLMNQSVHAIDLMLWLAGQPASVCAFTSTLTHRNIEVEDTAVASIRFANGALGTIEAATSCAPGFPRRIGISGEKGSATLEGDRLVEWKFSDQTEEDDRILEAGRDGEQMKGGTSDPAAINHLGHTRQITDFVNAIREGRPSLCPGEEGRRAVELICGVYESARSGRVIHFPVGDVALPGTPEPEIPGTD